MRKIIPDFMEAVRVVKGPFGTPYGSGAFGAFNPLCPIFPETTLKVMVTDGRPEPGAAMTKETAAVLEELMAWEHVSVSTPRRTPTWAEMCWVKEAFWEDSEVVMQLHVPSAEHVNIHSYCLHLWRPIPGKLCVTPQYVSADYGEPIPALSFTELPRPPHIAVGPLAHEVSEEQVRRMKLRIGQ